MGLISFIVAQAPTDRYTVALCKLISCWIIRYNVKRVKLTRKGFDCKLSNPMWILNQVMVQCEGVFEWSGVRWIPALYADLPRNMPTPQYINRKLESSNSAWLHYMTTPHYMPTCDPIRKWNTAHNYKAWLSISS